MQNPQTIAEGLCRMVYIMSRIGPYFWKRLRKNYNAILIAMDACYPLIFWREIEVYNLKDMWFQQNGATSHTTLANWALLQE